MAAVLYDEIGRDYARLRRPDPRLAARLNAALGPARTVINVGAGTGAYEPRDRTVVAVEPSSYMLQQRAADAAEAVQASAEALPFETAAFDAGMAVLTLHHWGDVEAGLRELKRVARHRVVIFTWDPAHPGFWLTQDYFPDLLADDAERFPSLPRIERILGPCDMMPVPIPHDCRDGFLGAYWRRPSMYLDPFVRSGMSTFLKIADAQARIGRLASDLADGVWERRHGRLRQLTELDLGYRLIVGRGGPSS